MSAVVLEQLQLGQGVDPLADAVAWRRLNPDAWRQLVLWAREDLANGGRPSIGLYAELLRRPWFARHLGLSRASAALLLNNNLRADLARLLNREHDLGFSTRKARADSW